MLSFPPHTSHKVQPLDLTVYGPLKKAYANQCDLFLRNNGHEKITPYDVAEIFKNAFVQTATIEKQKMDFKPVELFHSTLKYLEKKILCLPQ